jgi:mono/diheme cytochrome c family protein
MKRILISAFFVAAAFTAATAAALALRAVDGTRDAIALPYDSGELPKGPNFAVYKANCLSCHTSSYVVQMPKSPRSVWEASVKKMVDLYDAKISEEKQKLIVDYLMSVRGAPDNAAGSK